MRIVYRSDVDEFNCRIFFCEGGGQGKYKTLSYKTLPSEEEIIALSAYDRRRMEYRDGRILCDCAEERR